MRLALALLLSLALAGCNRSAPAPASQDASQQKPRDPAAPAPQARPAADTGAPTDVTPGTAQEGAAPPQAKTFAPESGRGSAAAEPQSRTPPEPEYREVTVPSGTTLPLELETAIASDTSQAEDAVRARLRRPLIVGGMTVAPAGTPVTGIVTAVEQAGKVKGRARLAFRFTSLRVDDERYDIRTSAFSQRARATKRKDAAKIGVPAAGGAIIGGIIGGKKGAAIGGAAGGGAGTAVVLSTRGEEVRLPAGTSLSVQLLQPLAIRVPRGRE